MKPDPVSLSCKPGTFEARRPANEQKDDGSAQEFLIGVDSGNRFLVREGIPVLLNTSTVSGFNLNYQKA